MAEFWQENDATVSRSFQHQHQHLQTDDSPVIAGLNNVLPVTQNLGQSQSQQGSCPAVASVPPVAQCAGREHLTPTL